MTIKRRLKPDFSEGIDRKDLSTLCQRFLTLVEHRLQRTRMAMSTRQQLVLDVLPLLFHVNHPLLPGYVSRHTPHGVRNFKPPKQTLRQAQILSRSFKFREPAKKVGDIVSVFLMGSTGSIAHSGASDLDIWLCYRNGLSKKLLTELDSKAEKISQWAIELGAEVHIFPMNAAAFRQGRGSARVDSEDCGTAQQYLLLDEFYRTSVWLAGAYPLWWLIPPGQEQQYSGLASMLVEKRFIRQRDFIDFGGCCAIPANEFVGAGMWQLYKGIDSPFKSVLKLKLIECYARDEQSAPPLCMLFKQAVFDDEVDADTLDPYVMIYRRIENSLSRHQEWQNLALVRRSFYLKVGEKLSRTVADTDKSWRRLTMEKLVAEWGFDSDLVKYLDSRQHWRIDEVSRERRAIVNELTGSYRFLSAYARNHGLAAAISARDINLLGRKLYAMFQRKAGKIEVLNPGIGPSLAEDSLAWHHLSSQTLSDSSEGWLIYRNLASPAEADFSPALKRSNSLIELVVWAHVNGLLVNSTSISLVAGKSAATSFELQHIVATLRSKIPLPMPPVAQQTFHDRVQLRQVLLFVNVGVDPMTELTQRGLHKITEHNDSLGYASSRTNLVLTLDKVLVNSWNEVMVQRFESGATLVQCLSNALAGIAEGQQFGNKLPELSVFCFCPQRAEAIARRVQELFEQVIACYFAIADDDSQQFRSRYLLQVERNYFLLNFEGYQPRFTVLQSYQALCDHLALPRSAFSPVEIDAYALLDDPLTVVLKKMSAHTINVFLQETATGSQLLVTDECGSLIKIPINASTMAAQLGGMSLFLYSVLERKQMRDSLDASRAVLPAVKFFKLSAMTTGNKGFRSEVITSVAHHGMGEYIEVQAVGQCDEHGELQFTFFCEHQEFSPADYGHKVADALIHYIDQRFRHSDPLPCIVTDLSLPHSLAEDSAQLPTSLYLTCKCQLEASLAKARSNGSGSHSRGKVTN